jgi:DsbC/DsbD-like thiol-disulfide interchange protein
MRLLHALGVALMAASGPWQTPSEVVRWSATAPQAPVAAGQTLRIALAAEIESGWHLYATTQPPNGPRPLVIALRSSQPFTVQARNIVAPSATVEHDPNFNAETQFYEEHVVLTVPVTVGKDVPPGKHTLTLAVTFQACSGRLCLRPFTQSVPVEVAIGSSKKGNGR